MRHRARAPMFATMSALSWLLLVAGAQASPPVCPDGSLTTTPGQRIALPANPCTDPEGDSYSLAVTTQPSQGTISLDSGTNYYNPSPGYHGTDQFTYTATDTNNEPSTVATVQVLIDTAPACSDGSRTVESGKQLTLAEVPCQDADRDFLYIFLSVPLHGTLDIAPDGSSATYTSATGYVGSDVITYYARDPFNLSSATGTLTITVSAPPAPPAPAPSPAPPAVPAPAVALSRDGTAPSFALTNAARRLKTVLTDGLRLSLTTDEGGIAVVTVTIDRVTARKLKLDRKANGPFRVARFRTTLVSGKANLVVKLTTKARKALRKARAVRLHITITITDAASNSTTHTTTITLKR